MESARGIVWRKGRHVRFRLERKKSRITVAIFVRISEAAHQRDTWPRHPEQVGINHVLSHLSRAGEVDKTVVARTKGGDWFPKRRIEMCAGQTRSGEIVAECRVRIAGREPKRIGQ